MQVLSHKQQLQVLNELVNLRTAVKKMASSDERWVEVIQKTILSQDELSMFKANSTLPLVSEPSAKKDFQDQSNQTLDLDQSLSQRTPQSMTNQKLPPPPPAEQPPAELVNRPHSPKRSTSANKYNTDAVQTV